MNKTLALIFAALALMIGSFIWFVATWDASREEPISQLAPSPVSSGPLNSPRRADLPQTLPHIEIPT